MKEENKKRLKKILFILLIILIVIIILLFGIGNYFVNYAISRNGGGGDREIKNEEVIEEIDDTDKKIIEQNKIIEEELANNWKESINNREVEVKSNDNLILRGTEYILDNSINKWVIVLHGYHSSPKAVLSIGRHFSNEGYNVLIPSMRASNESEGDYIGMGWLDKEDLKLWINLLVKENKNAEIVLHGSSMGAATVLMASGDELSKNVKAIIEDSGYTSVWDIFASEAKARFNLPTFPILNMFQLCANIRANYDIKEASALEQVKKSNIPILFIHGDKDDFVPIEMCNEVYEATIGKKEKFIVSGAGHTEAKYKEPEQYYNKVFEFLNNI